MDQERRDEDLGFMEYFDWLAGCTNSELITLSGDTLFDGGPLSCAERDILGRKIWAAM